MRQDEKILEVMMGNRSKSDGHRPLDAVRGRGCGSKIKESWVLFVFSAKGGL